MRVVMRDPFRAGLLCTIALLVISTSGLSAEPPPAPTQIEAPAPPATPADSTPQAQPPATIYKCVDGDGTTVYSDEPCGAANQMQELTLATEPVAAQAPAAAQCAEAHDDWQSGLLDAQQAKDLTPLQRQALAHPQARPASKGQAATAQRWRRDSAGAIHACFSAAGSGASIEIVAASDGRLIEFRRGIGTLLNDPRTPLALRERCRTNFDSCLAVGAKSADQCVVEAPTCGGAEPWSSGAECCPLACKSVYRQLRDRDVPGNVAFARALDGTPSCIPGIR